MKYKKLFIWIIAFLFVLNNVYSDRVLIQDDFSTNKSGYYFLDLCRLDTTSKSKFCELGNFFLNASSPYDVGSGSDVNSLSKNNFTFPNTTDSSWYMELNVSWNSIAGANFAQKNLFINNMSATASNGWLFGLSSDSSGPSSLGNIELNSFDGNNGCIGHQINVSLFNENQSTYINFSYNINTKNFSVTIFNSTTLQKLKYQSLISTCNYHPSSFSLGDTRTGSNQYQNYTVKNIKFVNVTNNSLIINAYYESTNTLITGRNVTVSVLSNIFSDNKTFSTGSINFTPIQAGDYIITGSGAGFSNRNYVVPIVADYSLNIYLLNTSMSSAKIFTTIDSSTVNIIPNVLLSLYVKIGIEWILVEQRYSDVIGAVLFNMDEDTTYRIIAEIQGYQTNDFQIKPDTDNSYNIQMISNEATSGKSLNEGINYFFFPINGPLNNYTSYDFMFNLTSNYWNITNCLFTLQNDSQNLIQNISTFNSTACNFRITYNTTRQSKITARVNYIINSQNLTLLKEYIIKQTRQGEFSLKTFIDDINNFADAGFDNFARTIMGFLIIFGIIGYLSYRDVLTIAEPERAILLIITLTWFISYLGWFDIDMSALPGRFVQQNADWISQYIIACLVTLTGIGYIINREAR